MSPSKLYHTIKLLSFSVQVTAFNILGPVNPMAVVIYLSIK